MNTKALVKTILEEKKAIRQVYWVACGGSVIDLYVAHFMLNAESVSMESGLYTSKEFVLFPPRKLGPHSLVVLCSHSGGTQETLDAGILARETGATVMILTHQAGSKCCDPQFITWVYPWGNEVPTAQVPSGISLALAAELMLAQEGFRKYEALMAGMAKLDEILPAARAKVNAQLGDTFAAMCQKFPFLYILGSGANFSQTYGFAICSLMEMQWQHCAYIHSGEYFHGPFEVTENGVFYFLQMGSGQCRPMDQRALDFLKTHTDSLMVLDTLDYGMDTVDLSVRDYLDPVLLYAMNVELRAARGNVFDHHPDVRRYMGIEQY